MATKKVEVEITATDEASPKIDRLEQKIDGLEADEARVVVTAQMGRTEQQLNDAKAKLEQLDGDEATVQARLVGSLEQDLADANRLFEQLDGKSGTVKLKVDSSELDNAKQKLDGLVSAASGLPGPLGAAAGFLSGGGGIAAGAVAAAGALFAAANSSADMAINAGITAELTGASTEEASRLQAVWDQTGADVNDLNDILLNMNDVLTDQPELAAKLGINLQDGRDGVERIVQLLGLLEQSQLSVNEKVAVMGDLFGEEGVRQIERMMVLFPDLEAAMDAVSGSRVISDQEVEQAREFKNETRSLGDEFKDFAYTVGGQAVPVITTFFKTWNEAIDSVEPGMKRLRALLDPEAMRNWNISHEWELGEQAARSYDKTLLEGLSTWDEVHAQVLQHTNSLIAANIVTTEWKTNRDAATKSLKLAHIANQDFTRGQNLVNAAIEAAVADTGHADEVLQDLLDTQREEEQAAFDLSVAISGVSSEMRDLAAAQDELRGDALADALDLGDDAIDTLNSVQQINEDLRALAAWVKEEGVPNIFDPDDVDAAPFLSKISQLKTPIQEQVAQAMEDGGSLAAQAVAESFVTSFSQQTGIAPDDVRHLLGLDDLTAKIKVSIEVSEVEQAKTQLGFLQTLLEHFPGATFEDFAWVIDMQMRLDAKTITGEQAQLLTQEKLRGLSVPIPTELAVPDDAKARREAEAAFARDPLQIAAEINVTPVSSHGLQYNPRAPGATVTNVTHNYVPGSPTTTVDLFNLSLERNGSRTNG